MSHKLPVAKNSKPVPVKIVDSGPSVAADNKWRAESDLRTMKDYQALCNDKTRYGAAKKLAKEEIKNLSKVVK